MGAELIHAYRRTDAQTKLIVVFGNIVDAPKDLSMCFGTVSKNTERAACDLNFGPKIFAKSSNFVKKKRPGGADFFFPFAKLIKAFRNIPISPGQSCTLFLVRCLVTWCPVDWRHGNVSGLQVRSRPRYGLPVVTWKS